MDQPPRRPRPHLLIALAALAVFVAVVAVVGITHRLRGADLPRPAPSAASVSLPLPAPTWSASRPTLPADVVTAWAYLDSTEGNILRGGAQDPHPLGQLVVPGIAEDYLDTLAGRGQKPNARDVATLYAALTGSDAAGDQLADLAGGVDQVFPRVIGECQLTGVDLGPPRATVLDVARYGACLREGAIADRDTSDWVLDQMRKTAGGIGDVRGDDGGQRLAQFNATQPDGGDRMRTTCLGIGAYWSAAVVVDWPAGRGDLYGVAACAEVARAQFPPDTQKAPAPPTPSSTCPYETCRGTD